MKNLKKMLILCSLVLVFTLILADVSAAADTVMATAGNKAIQLFRHIKSIIFIVGGFGLVGIAFQAIFGKVKWSWFAGLAVGLAILACASAIINYATGDTAGMKAGATEQKMEDTFTGAGTGEMK